MINSSEHCHLRRRALCLAQSGQYPLYVFTLKAEEVLRLADISRIRRDPAGELIGYQRPEVRRHIQEIVDYLDAGEPVIFPNPIIMALSSRVQFQEIRGNRMPGDELGITGTLTIPLPVDGQAKPAWIVDGQQRALALSRIKRPDFPVPVTAFVADTVTQQRDQFLRVNNTKPLPRGLVNELLPEVDTILPPRLTIRKAPSALCDVLNKDERSPFRGMVKRTSTPKNPKAVITDTAIIQMIQESLGSPSGCLYPYRDLTRNETDFDGIVHALSTYWAAVRDTFPEAWGRPPTRSRLMHGAGIRAMGRLMDRILGFVDLRQPDAPEVIRKHLALLIPHCRWTAGIWEGIGLRWNEIQNMGRHSQELSSYLIRVYLDARAELR